VGHGHRGGELERVEERPHRLLGPGGIEAGHAGDGGGLVQLLGPGARCGCGGAERVALRPLRPPAVEDEAHDRHERHRHAQGEHRDVARVAGATGRQRTDPSRWRSTTSTAVALTASEPGTGSSTSSDRSTVQVTVTWARTPSTRDSKSMSRHIGEPSRTIAAASASAVAAPATGSRAMLMVRAPW